MRACLILSVLITGTQGFVARGRYAMTLSQKQQNAPFFPFKRNEMRKSMELNAQKGENADARQLLGIKGGSQSDNIWAIRLQLCKPVTWIPLIWGVACGE